MGWYKTRFLQNLKCEFTFSNCFKHDKKFSILWSCSIMSINWMQCLLHGLLWAVLWCEEGMQGSALLWLFKSGEVPEQWNCFGGIGGWKTQVCIMQSVGVWSYACGLDEEPWEGNPWTPRGWHQTSCLCWGVWSYLQLVGWVESLALVCDGGEFMLVLEDKTNLTSHMLS